MDPLEVLADISDFVLQHFSAKELLTLTEVHPFWNEVIGSSVKAMSKIKVLINVYRSNSEILESASSDLVKSSRKYQEIEMLDMSGLISTTKSVHRILIEPERKWKSITLKHVTLDSLEQLETAFNIIEKSLETLEIDEISFRFPAIGVNFTNKTFPKLKVLRLKHHNWNSFHHAFTRCQNLNEFRMCSSKISSEPVLEILKRNVNLNILEVSTAVFYQIFSSNDEFWQKNNLKLNTFEAHFTSHTSHDVEKIRKNFLNFLNTQAESLETLVIDRWMGVEVLKLIFHLPKLKNLTIDGLKNLMLMPNWRNFSLKLNKSIQNLTFYDVHPEFQIVKSLIDATPNLTHLEMHSMDQQVMEYLSENSKDLKALKLRAMEATDFSSRHLFPKLQEFAICIVFANQEDAMKLIPEEGRNSLVKLLLLQSDYTFLH